MGLHRMRMKRAMDLVISSAALVFALPFLAVAALAVRIAMGAPVLFRQVRPGLYGKPFTLYKLRTMTSKCDDCGCPLPDECRLTALGKFLRRSSIDELPQLWNVLKGDMSVVGPRPLLMAYLGLYTPDQRRRHEVKPGLVGWAGVNGRNEITWEMKLDLDLWYVDHWSVWLDLKIMLMAVPVVIRGSGVNSPGSATCARFDGTFRQSSQ